MASPVTGASIEYVTGATVYGVATQQLRAEGARFVESVDVMGPPPQLAVDTTSVEARNRPKGSATLGRAEPKPWRTDPPTAVKRPLSAYMAQREPHCATDAAPQPDALTPGTTVASFRWPAVCHLLSQQSGTGLDRIAKGLSEQTRQGSSLVGIIGLFPACGCSTVALSLAGRLAASRRVIVVDANFRKPELAAWLDVVPTAGWQEVLEQKAALSDAIVHAQRDRVDLLALTGTLANNSLHAVSSPQAAHCASLLRTAYDLGLVDLGAFFDAASQPLALELVRRMRINHVLAVTGPRGGDLRDLATIAQRLGQCGCELLGTIENRIPSDL